MGDKYASSVSLSLLNVSYVLHSVLLSDTNTTTKGNYLSSKDHYSEDETVKYFPVSSLPADPAQRFSDLFLTRSKWKNEDIIPFLSDIAVNAKERDKMLLKYARATTDAQGIWYTARAQYNG